MIPPHGGQLHAIAAQFNRRVEDLTDFSANINPAGPAPAVLAALHNALQSPAILADYPDLHQTALKRACARHAQVNATQVAVANGFVPLLDAVLRALTIRTCVLPVPCFGDYRRTLERSHITIFPQPLQKQHDFRYDFDPLLQQQADAILLANPQNPSGVLTRRDHLFALLPKAEAASTFVLLDEAFIDYAAEESLTPLLAEFPHLVIFRSITKFFAIPGLRVAFAAASPALADRIDAMLPPWPISSLASVGAIAAIESAQDASAVRLLNQTRREDLRKGLQALGIATYPAAANFLLLRLPANIPASDLWQRLILRHGIVVRLCENFEALDAGHLRIAVRTEAQNDRLLRAFAVEL